MTSGRAFVPFRRYVVHTANYHNLNMYLLFGTHSLKFVSFPTSRNLFVDIPANLSTLGHVGMSDRLASWRSSSKGKV